MPSKPNRWLTVTRQPLRENNTMYQIIFLLVYGEMSVYIRARWPPVKKFQVPKMRSTKGRKGGRQRVIVPCTRADRKVKQPFHATSKKANTLAALRTRILRQLEEEGSRFARRVDVLSLVMTPMPTTSCSGPQISAVRVSQSAVMPLNSPSNNLESGALGRRANRGHMRCTGTSNKRR